MILELCIFVMRGFGFECAELDVLDRCGQGMKCERLLGSGERLS